jgi:hypothetical protein
MKIPEHCKDLWFEREGRTDFSLRVEGGALVVRTFCKDHAGQKIRKKDIYGPVNTNNR